MNQTTRIRKRRTGQPGALLIVAVLLLAASAGCTVVTSQTSGQPTAIVSEQLVTPATPLPTAPAEAPIPTATAEAPVITETTEALLPAGWLTFSNQRCPYAISYPAEMEVSDQGATSQLFSFKLDSLGAGPSNFIYVSLIDQSNPDTGEGIIYNYDPVETETLLNMQVGESQPSRDFGDVAEWFTYERKADTPIGGYDAQSYENVQPWEFPVGTKEIRYYLTLPGCTYLIGGYLDSTGSSQAGAISEELFNQIMATVQIP